MRIKRTPNRFFHVKFKKSISGTSIVKTTVGVLLLGIFFLVSVYYGMYLKQTGKASTLKEWALSIKHHQLSFVENYLRSIVVSPPQLVLDVSYKNWQKIAFTRDQAVQAGGLFLSDEWVPAKIQFDDKTYTVEIKLKGDKEDHWRREDVWSLKVKVKGDDTILGMKRFALQHPETREYMNEWMLHQLLGYADLLHLRYTFLELTINGEKKPIMALEENFEKILIEHNEKREGLIFRFDTSYAWLKEPGVQSNTLSGPILLPYDDNEIETNDLQKQQFETVTTRIEQFREGKLAAHDVFDIQTMAKAFAIIDLMGHHHATSIDNMKFYFNPITARVEPIAYDNSAIVSLAQEGLHGEGKTINSTPVAQLDWLDALFQDKEFFAAYIQELAAVSDPVFLDNFFSSIEEDYQRQLAILHKSYPWYVFQGEEILRQNQRYIQTFLDPRHPIRAYADTNYLSRGILSVDIINLYSFPLEVVGLESDGIIYPVHSGDGILLQGNETSQALKPVQQFQFSVSTTFDISKGMYLRYAIVGLENDVRSASVSPWSRESVINPDDLLPYISTIDNFSFIEIEEQDHTVTIPKGTWSVDDDLVVPNGYTFVIEPGSVITLSDSANIISYSPISFIGDEKNPITIRSLDGTGQGIVVINAAKPSYMRWVDMVGLSSPWKERWSLTGSVTFYQSDVTISDTSLIQNNSEDTLNIVRSQFTLENVLFEDTFSDAFDSDFSSGTIKHSTFNRLGNDGVDVSGTTAFVEDIHVSSQGDKGISVGEDSKLEAYRVVIESGNIGIASKDKSQFIGKNIALTGLKVGLTAYQKKPEFGPASIIATNVSMNQIVDPVLQEKQSRVVIDGVQYNDFASGVYDRLYGTQ